MIRPIHHPASGCRMDIASATPGDISFLADLRENLHHSQHGLICETAGGDQRVYVVRRPGGGYSVRHYPGNGHHQDHHVIPESDEHKRGKDYHVSELDRFGVSAAKEIPTDNHTKHDVVTLDAPRIIAVEFQAHNRLEDHEYKRRTTLAMRATALRGQHARVLPDGVLPVWVHAFGMPRGWKYPVPSIAAQDTRWDVMPKPGSVTAIGVRTIEAERCRPGSRWPACPRLGRYFCGSFHPLAVPRPGLRVGEVTAMVARGELVPIRHHTGAVYLVLTADAARYAELGGAAGYTSGSVADRPSARRLGPCQSWRHDLEPPTPAAPVLKRDVPIEVAAEPHLVINSPKRSLTTCDVPGCGHSAHLYSTARWLCDNHIRLQRAVVSATKRPLETCRVPGCGQSASLYPAGWLCDNHKPRRQPERKAS